MAGQMPHRLRQKHRSFVMSLVILPRYSIRFFVVLATVVLCAFPLHAQGQSTNAIFSENKEVIPVNVLVGQSQLIPCSSGIERFSVSSPEIAEAVLVGGNQ